MGNHLSCFTGGWRKTKKGFRLKAKSRKRAELQEGILQQQAIALLLHQQPKAQSQKYNRASSQRYPSATLKQGLPRSSSARPRSLTDPVVQPQQLMNESEDATLSENLETKTFVLIHGGGFGAWSWYKSIALLESSGFVTKALDLTGSGIDSTNTNKITSLEHYAQPLIEFLGKLPDNEKVILVGHSFGGACISYAMERYPKKIAKAIFIAGTMVKNEQRAYDVFASEVATSNDLIQNAQIFIYANGNTCPPTALEFDKSQMKELFFNQTSPKDVALAMVSFRPVPFAPVMEKLFLTEENYGSVRRFFIQTMDDQALTSPMQERIVEINPPEKVLKLKGSDHCPFFSKPQSLHKFFVEIAHLEATQGQK